MGRKNIITGLEISRTRLSMAAIEVRNGEPNLLDTSKVQCRDGVKNGLVINLESVTEAIVKLVEEVNQKTKKRVNCAFVNISGLNIKEEIAHSVITLPQRGCEITQRHIEDLIESCKIVSIPLDRTLLYILPLEYIIDGQDRIKNPLGLCGSKLEAKILIVTAPFNQIQNIIKATNFAGLEVEEVVLTSVANSYSLLTQEERKEGILLIDFKTDFTEVSIFKGDALLFFNTIPKGQEALTNEIARRFNMPFEVAEGLKIKYGFLDNKENIDDRNQEGIPWEWVGKRENILRGELNKIIRHQLELIFNQILGRIKDFKDFNNIVKRPAAVTGGCTSMDGFLEWASSRLGFLVRQGPEEFITSLGLAKFGLKRQKELHIKGNVRFFNKVFQKAGEVLSDYF